jgi:hypothetical protein
LVQKEPGRSFLSAALALEARADGAQPDMIEYDRHFSQH